MKNTLHLLLVLLAASSAHAKPEYTDLPPAGQFSVLTQNEIDRAEKAIEGGDTSIFTKNELYIARRRLAAEQAAYEATLLRPQSPRQTKVNWGPVEIPAAWKKDQYHQALAEVFYKAQAGQGFDKRNTTVAYADFLANVPAEKRTAEENAMLRALSDFYAKDADGKITRNLFDDSLDYMNPSNRGAEVQQEKHQRAKAAQLGYSMDIGAALRFSPEDIYGLGGILTILKMRMESKKIDLAVAFQVIVETVRKHGMSEIMKTGSAEELKIIQDLVFRLTGRKPFTEAADRFVKLHLANLAQAKTSMVYKNSMAELTRSLNILSIASNKMKCSLQDFLNSRNEPFAKLIIIPKNGITCKAMLK